MGSSSRTIKSIWVAVLLAFLVPAAFVPRAAADVVDFSTGSNSDWTVTGGGEAAAPAFYLALPLVSITSNSLESGQFAAGGTLGQFTGAWYADFQFTLPAGATDVSLSFSNLVGDDRTVLQLNGTDLGDYFLNGNNLTPPLTGAGDMRFPSESSDQPYTFTGTTSGTVTTGFVTGINDIRLVVNNTNKANLTANTATFQSSSDSTDAGVLGTVNFSAPEPSGISIGVLASLAFMVRCRRAA
jgi:hypothetical protein